PAALTPRMKIGVSSNFETISNDCHRDRRTTCSEALLEKKKKPKLEPKCDTILIGFQLGST
ncbi:MAG: hypothetical protein KUG59_09575, partial [Parvibaculaceae bacterium]|nr:hypothetical protein [Parvibaculaceae bacterium]